MKNSRLRKIVLCLLAVILMLSATAVVAFAEDTGVEGAAVENSAAVLAKIGDEEFATVAQALEYARAAEMTDVVITLCGDTTKESAKALEDVFDLYCTSAFDNVTFKQEDPTKVYYIDCIYTGNRTDPHDGKFVFDGVNIHVTGQYMFEGNVKLINNSVITSSAEANCFFYYCWATIEPGSRIQGVIEDFRGGNAVIDGGRNDGLYNDQPSLRDSILVLNWGSESIVIKNGAYVNVNGADEVGRLTINNGAYIELLDSKLSAVEYINVGGQLLLNTESLVSTRAIKGSGSIIIDATLLQSSKTLISADFSGFTGSVVLENNDLASYAITENGLEVRIPVAAKIGDKCYPTLEAAAAAAVAGDVIELVDDVTLAADLTLPAGITLNGAGKIIEGNIVAGGDLTFVGYTKVSNFNAGYNKPTITISEGACLETTTGRMVIGHGATFIINGSISDAKTANVADLTASLIAPGASFTGAGVNFNVNNAYIKFSAYCSSKNSSANNTFNFNVSNSIWEQTGSLTFSEPTSGKDPTINFVLTDSVLNTTSHIVFGVSKGNSVIDNSIVNYGANRQLENRHTLTIKNGSVVYAANATSSNAKNPGTLIIDNATYVGSGEFSGAEVGIGTLIVKNGANATVGNISKANVTVDVTSTLTLTKILTEASVKIDATEFDGESVLVIKSANLAGSTVITVEGSPIPASLILDANGATVEKAVAKIGDKCYTSLKAAIEAVEEGDTIVLLTNEVFTEANRTYNSGSWYDGIYYVGDKSFTIDLGGFTVSNDNGAVNDYLFNFKNDGSKANVITIKNGTLDAGTVAFCALCTSGASAQQIAIDLENVTLINNNSNGSTAKIRGGAVLNVKSGTTIIGKNSYLAIECIAATVNIYDGAELYMNGASSYNGCLVGVGSGGTVNAFGGYGKGVKGGFIAMTSGGTINVYGGEWIANTDGTVGDNSNLYVLTAQNNKYESGYVGASIINVYGGTLRGGMDAWCLNAGLGEQAELNITGGNFNANPARFTEYGHVAAAQEDGTYTVIEAVAQIGNQYYKTLAEAIAAAGADDVIYVLFDVEEEFASFVNVKFATNAAGGVTITNTASNDSWIAFQNVTVGSGVTLFSANILTNGAYTNIIEGTLITGAEGTTGGTSYYQCNDAVAIVRNGGKIVVNGDVVLRYNDEDGAGIFIYGDNDANTVEFSTTGYIGAYSGAFYAENSVITTGTDLRLDFHDIKNGVVKGEEADKYDPVVAEFVNSTVTVNGQLRLYKDANLVLNNSDLHAGILQVRSKADPVVSVGADSSLTADTVEIVTGALVHAFRDDAGNVTFVPAVAYIVGTMDKSFLTLEEALAEANNGDTIVLIRDAALANTITINKSITLDGNGFKVVPADSSKTYNSAFMVGDSGWGDDHGETIVIKNIEICGWKTSLGVIRAQGITLVMEGATLSNNYVSNDAYAVVALNYADATITACKFLNNTSKVFDVNYNADSSKSVVLIDACEFIGNSSVGAGIIYRNAGEKLTIKDSKFIDNTVSTNGNAATVYLGWGSGHEIIGCTFDDNTVITSHATTKRFASAIFCDGCTVSGNIFGAGNTAVRNGEEISTLVAVGAYYGAADINANYWINGSEPVLGKDYTIEYTRNPVAITTYYTSYENGVLGGLTVIKTPAGNVAYRAYITDSSSREAIQIDLENVYAKESFVIKLYDANGNLLTVTTYRAGGVDAANFTCNIVLWGSASGSWATEIMADLTVSNVPALVEIIADGIVVDSYQHESGSVLADKLGAYKALDCVAKAAKVGNSYYATLKEAFAALSDGATLEIFAGVYSEGTIQLPATLNNVTIKGNEGAILKDMVISTPDGNSYSFIGLTFDAITFENSYILLTGWRTGVEIIKDLAVTNCVFKNINNSSNTAAVHINKDAAEAVENFIFSGNVIDGLFGGQKSGVYAQVTGNIVFTNNVINNVSFRPYVVQITTDDGIADEFTVTGNVFSGTAAGRAQGLGSNSEGTDSVKLVVSNNIFKDITASQQICYWNFNSATTVADLSGNYYSIDILANPSRIYYNSAAASVEDLIDMGIFPIYTALNEDGTIDYSSAYDPTALPNVEIKYTNVVITENFKISFAFAAATVENWNGYYVVINKVSADDGSVSTITIPTSAWKATTIGGESYIVVEYAGIAAKELCDIVEVTVYNADGTAVSDIKTDSIKDYAMRKLANATDAKLITLLVDMLNYGAEAQNFFGYATDKLANADLTAEQQAYASAGREYSDDAYSKNYADGYSFNVGNTLSLEYNIQLKVGLDLRALDFSDDAKIVVSYVDYKGNTVVKEVMLSNYNYKREPVYVSCDTLTALDSDAQISFTLVEGGDSVVIFTNSVESFTARLGEGNNKVAICSALMKYCDSAAAYFNK